MAIYEYRELDKLMIMEDLWERFWKPFAPVIPLNDQAKFILAETHLNAPLKAIAFLLPALSLEMSAFFKFVFASKRIEIRTSLIMLANVHFVFFLYLFVIFDWRLYRFAFDPAHL